MNQKQALALALGLIAGIALAVFSRPGPVLSPVSTQTRPDGGIVTTYVRPNPLWPRVALGVVIVVTGLAVYTMRRRD